MLLGLDLGTTNIKALVTDRDGRALGQGSCAVELFRSSNGGVEQDVEEIWRATLAAIQQAVVSIDAAQIRAVGVSSQGGALQFLGPDDQPRCRVISWLDQRGRPFDEELTRELGRAWFLQHILHGGSWLSIGQILRLRKEHPEWFGGSSGIGFVGDVIVGRLCGAPAHDGTSAALTLLYNPALRAYDPDLLARLGLAPRQLPRVLPPACRCGCLLPEVAAQIWLRAGIPVSPAVHDQYASALAVGATRPGTVMVGTGTAWVLLHVTDQTPEPLTDEALVCHHVIDGLWGQILSMVNGGSAVTWALELTGQSKKAEAIDALLAAAPPGSDGLRFWPFLTPAGPSGLAPGPRGRLTGLQLHHSAPHLARAVVEGLAYELGRYLGLFRANGQPVASLILGGGAAASAITPQIVADVSGLPLRCFAGGDAALMGAVVLARALLEPGQPLSALAQQLNAPSRDVFPGLNRTFYQHEFHRYMESLPLIPSASS
jgi:sugar (pentulose or hexulose) kinase